MKNIMNEIDKEIFSVEELKEMENVEKLIDNPGL